MNVFLYNDYRKYLQDYVDTQSAGIKKHVAASVGVSASLLSQILAGDRDLSKDQAYSFASFMQFNPLETNYWLTLLDHHKAESPKLKQFYANLLKGYEHEFQYNNRTRSGLEKTNWTPEYIAVFYSSWHFPAIYCALAIPEKWTCEKFAKRFNLPLQRVQYIMNFFVEHNIVSVAENSDYVLNKAGYVYVSAPDAASHEAAVIHNTKNFRQKALAVFEENQFVKNREPIFRSLMALLSQEDYKDLEKEIFNLVEKFHQKVAAKNYEEIVCLNIDFFKI